MPHLILRLTEEVPTGTQQVLIGPCPSEQDVSSYFGHDRFKFDARGYVVFDFTPRAESERT